jgi:3-oxoadipate enol-lactonase
LWNGVSAQLSDAGYRVLALDARGHGQSTWDGQDFSIKELAEDAAAVMDELRIPAADVIGMSMGGCTALELALQRPDLIRRLVLADTTASYGPDRVQQWETRAVQAEESPRESLLDFQLTRWFSDNFRGADPAACDHASAVFAETSSVVHAAACRALGGFDVTRKLSRIHSDSLVLVGEEDYATPPAMAQALAAGLPHARLRILPDTRHYSLIENQEIWGVIREHLAGGVAR